MARARGTALERAFNSQIQLQKKHRYLTLIERLCDLNKLPRPTPEFQFHPTRKWRADFCWEAERVVLEVDGGSWVNGRHNRGSGWLLDAEKRRAYAALGYLVLPVTPDQAAQGIWVNDAREALRWNSTRIDITHVIKLEIP